MKAQDVHRPSGQEHLTAPRGRTLPVAVVCLALALLWSGCGSPPVPPPPVAIEVGQVARLEDRFGPFYAYVPATAPPEPDILVLVHGTTSDIETPEASAHFFIVSWTDFAEKHGLVLIAPAFDQEHFSSHLGDHALGGYRGLFGRDIAADAWVLRLVGAHQQAYGGLDKRFYLYGHSAGGQFVARFLVTHPELVQRAVISAAATYPQPDAAVAWPFGMGELVADVEWDAETVRHVDVISDKQKWLAATQIPLTVIIGLNDTSELPAYPGQNGKNRFVIARNWVRDMEAFAAENGLTSRFQFEVVPGKGHSMSGLLRFSEKAMLSE